MSPYFTEYDVGPVAAYFLTMDQSDPDVDYNDEAAPQVDVQQYRNEAASFLHALNYFFNNISEDSSEVEITQIVFTAAREFDANNVSRFFTRLYQVLTGFSSGAKIAPLIKLLGVTTFKRMVQDRVTELF